MTTSKSALRVLTLALLVTAAPALADDIRPQTKARPMADEKCIEQCDLQSDQCMQKADGDSGKMQVCDDKYSECLQACERAGAR